MSWPRCSSTALWALVTGPYSTVVADVAEMVTLEPVTAENTASKWVTLDEMAHLPLHPGVDQVVLVSTRN